MMMLTWRVTSSLSGASAARSMRWEKPWGRARLEHAASESVPRNVRRVTIVCGPLSGCFSRLGEAAAQGFLIVRKWKQAGTQNACIRSQFGAPDEALAGGLER